MAAKADASGIYPKVSELDVLVEEILAKEEAYNEVHISDLARKKEERRVRQRKCRQHQLKGDGKFEGNSKEEGRLL